MPDDSINLGKDVVRGETIETASKGVSFARPLSRFDGVRKLIVLEWTPLNEKGQLGDPVRIPFLINPEAIDWSHQHVFSQQQTRGGWVHTHWNDKPLSIRIRGNSGAYEYQKINLLRYAFKVSGKSYLELKAYQERKGRDRDKFLSEHLGKQDSDTLKKLISDTTFTNQGFFRDFLTSDALYEHIGTVGKEALKPVQTAISLSIKATAVANINNNLYILKERQKQKAASQQAVTGTSQNIKGGNQNKEVPILTDKELMQSFNHIQQIPTNRLVAGISYTMPPSVPYTPNSPNFSTGIQTSTLSNQQILSSPAGRLNQSLNTNNSGNYALLRNFLNLNQFEFLRGVQGIASNYGADYLRFDNPVPNNSFITSTLNQIENLRLLAQFLRGQSGLITLSVEDDLQLKLTELNSIIIRLEDNLDILQEELIILNRRIKIQSKRLDTEIEAKHIKKIKTKIQKANESIAEALKATAEITQLLTSPLASTIEEKERATKLLEAPDVQQYAKFLQDKFQGVNLLTSQNREAFYNTINTQAKLQPNGPAGRALTAYHLYNSGMSYINMGNQGPKALNNFDNPEVVYNYIVGGANLANTGTADNIVGESGWADIMKNMPRLAAIQAGKVIVRSDNKAAEKELIDLSANSRESVQKLIGGQNNYSIFDSKNFKLKPALPDVVKLRLYYNGSIYEGFMANFDWHEVAETSNITYDFEFVVEREMLGASLDNLPVSIKKNPGSSKSYSAYRAGDFDPTAGNVDYGRKPSYSATVTGRILPQSDSVASAPIGSQRPNPYPVPGAQQNIPLNPDINNPNNKVNFTDNTKTTSDPSNLNDQVANDIAGNI